MKRKLLSIAVATALTTTTLQAQVLEEVMVTAQKREQSANDIGLSVTAFSNQQMEALGIEEATDVMAFTPGATLTSSGQGIPIYTIRGIGFDDYNSNSSSTVGINVDEVALPYPIMTRLPQYDIERLEVLKGPQGTLYGQNTTGGTINFITNKPEFGSSASIRVAYDSDEKITTQGFLLSLPFAAHAIVPIWPSLRRSSGLPGLLRSGSSDNSGFSDRRMKSRL